MHPKEKRPERVSSRGATGCRRRPTLPRSLDRSTIGAAGLNDRVRDGNGCGPCASAASDATSALNNWQVTDRVVSGHESAELSCFEAFALLGEVLTTT